MTRRVYSEQDRACRSGVERPRTRPAAAVAVVPLRGQHRSGEQFARLSLEYFNHYDLDFLKVMNDYFYPAPLGMETIKTAVDLRHLGPLKLEQTEWAQQFRALEVIAKELRGRAYFIDTVFDPWQTIRRSMAGENMQALMDEAPAALLDALEVVAGNLIAYCKKSLALGSAGIFMSVPAAVEIVSARNS